MHCKLHGMNPLDDLARTDIDPALLAQVRALVEKQQADLARRDALLAEKDFKITALTHELAYYRRVRFGKASEALVGEQRMLFDETVDIDLAAIEEELEAQAPVKRQRKRAGRGAARGAAQSLDRGLPVLETRISLIRPDSPYYRGRSAVAAVREKYFKS